ncbi:FAD-binding domain-containing protein [Xylaria bambusicola]|uniref:FAD-binding domain-containing protein n=1 Tax=Xylaria bambusicola TaxID=326684 RepID=UPI002007696A|nr:FAD-binding domain-containing protein [Xylaria bambusicola]KAI0521217.1 FAD-binding domain-containing protein [Xylaria bambusicola]
MWPKTPNTLCSAWRLPIQILVFSGLSQSLTADPLPVIRSQTPSPAHQACSLAKTAFKASANGSATPEYIDAQSNSYVNRTQVNWSSNNWQNASCIVSPQDVQDVARVIGIITSTQSPFSIRSGGHDFNKNHSTVENGVIIDMVNFNDITLSVDKSSITVGVGTRWGAVYQALNGTGVSVNGARSPDPAIGGQTISGGSGWLNNIAGPTAASVIAADVVLANASIIHATEQNAADLLWALRGGGPNYGIVISFTYKTLPVDKVWYGTVQFPAERNRELLDALVEYRQLAAKDSKASIVFGLSTDTSVPASFVGFFYADAIEYPSVFSPFYNLTAAPGGITPRLGTLADLTAGTHSPQYPEPGTVPSSHYAVTMPHKVDKATYNETYTTFTSLAEEASDRGWVFAFGSQPISANAARAASNMPLGLEVVEQDWAYATLGWESPDDDSDAMGLLVRMGQGFGSAAARHDTKIRYLFMNDAYDGQPVLSSYGVENVQKLRDISRKYDPHQVFQRLQNGGWLLSRETA